jgi:hypothetical protein
LDSWDNFSQLLATKICAYDGAIAPSQNALFYEFCLENYVPQDHLPRQLDPILDLSDLRDNLSSYYSPIGRPSIDPELMIRMLIVGYCVNLHLNLVCHEALI